MVLGRLNPWPRPRWLWGPPFGPQVPPERSYMSKHWTHSHLYRNIERIEVCTNNNFTVLLSVLLYCYSRTLPGYAKTTACKQATQCQWTLVSSSKLRGIVRIAQEISLLYTDIRQATTNLTDRQTVSHNHYAKVIRNLATMIATVMMITTVSLTGIRSIATNQATNDN